MSCFFLGCFVDRDLCRSGISTELLSYPLPNPPPLPPSLWPREQALRSQMNEVRAKLQVNLDPGQDLVFFWCEKTGSGRVFSGFGIWPKYGAGIGKTINILTGSGIWLFPGNRDSPKIGHGMRDLCLCVCREWRKPSRPTGSSGQSELTRRALSGVSFQTKHPMECLVNRS